MKYLTFLTLALTLGLGLGSDLLPSTQAAEAEAGPRGPPDPLDHPLFDKEEMGYMVWTVMHMYSAYVPESPTFGEQRELVDLVTLLFAN